MLYIVFALGFCLFLGLPPINFYFSAVFSICGLYYILTKYSKSPFLIGLIFGLGYFISSLYWLIIPLLDAKVYIAVGLLPIIYLMISLQFAGSCYLFSKGRQSSISFAVIFTTFEFIRCFIMFEWNLIGHSFTQEFENIIRYTGMHSVTFFALLFCSSLIDLLEKKLESAIILLLICCLISFRNDLIVENHDVTVGIVQPNLHCVQDDCYNELYEKMKSIAKNNDRAQIIVLPESAISFIKKFEYRKMFNKLERDFNSDYLILGATTMSRQHELFNTLVMFDFINDNISDYDKAVLVPFGEYIPFRNILKFNKLVESTFDFSRGTSRAPLKIMDISFIPLICYEGAVSNNEFFFNREFSDNNDGDFIINITNDSWYKKSNAPYQHLEMVRTKAIEYGIPIIRASLNGVSAIIDSYGRIVDSIPLGTEGYLKSYIPKKFPTFYSLYKVYINITMICYGIIFCLSRIICYLLSKFRSN